MENAKVTVMTTPFLSLAQAALLAVSNCPNCPMLNTFPLSQARLCLTLSLSKLLLTKLHNWASLISSHSHLFFYC